MEKRVLHCWTGYRDSLEFGSEEWTASWGESDKTCMLPSGHEGPHEWTPDNEIGVRFV